MNKQTTLFYSQTTIKERRLRGQFMTPAALANELADLVPWKRGWKVLDPAVGTGQLLLPLINKGLQLEGWDIDPFVMSHCNIPAMLQVKDALLDTQENVYDAIIMNPPYFTVPTHSPYYPLYGDVITGRANIFSFFIVRALSLVKSGGYVAMIVPPSMNNGAYFSRLRKYIADIASIENIVIKGQGQFQAMTEVQLIVLKKGTTNSHFIFRRDNSLIFTADLSYVQNQWQGACSIRDLDYKVTVGTIVWNRHDFTDRGIPLVYGRDIQNGKIILDNRENRYLDANESTVITPPALMVRRVIGKHPHRKIDAAIADFPCFGENHVNVIQAEHPRVDMMTLLQQLLATPPRYLDAITGSAQLSKVELETLIPLRP